MANQLPASTWIWKEGEFIAWEDATVHLLSMAVQFGTSIFEGIRCYSTPRGPAIFRLEDHLRRLFDSCTIYRMPPGFSPEELRQACHDTVRKNDHQSCYVRPMVLRGFGSASMHPGASPIETFVATWAWGAYLGEDALRDGVDVCVSSWNRAHPNTFPQAAKSAGHYNNAQLIKMEAVENGYVEGIALGPGGLVSEGSGQNVFLVRDGVVITPSVDGTSLSGITRDSVITIATELGFPVREQLVPRESLYTADELFFTGTASEVTPIRSVDRVQIGEGAGGPITTAIQERYLGIVKGELEDSHGWLSYVESDGEG